MSIFVERELVSKAYPGESWQKKVLAMSDSQIIAVLFRLIKSGKVRR